VIKDPGKRNARNQTINQTDYKLLAVFWPFFDVPDSKNRERDFKYGTQRHYIKAGFYP
jgi:hypothetical protein